MAHSNESSLYCVDGSRMPRHLPESVIADDYLVKPFDGDVLLARVRGIFERAEKIPA